MSLLSKLISFFRPPDSVNREFSTVYSADDIVLAEEQPQSVETGTYDMYQDGIEAAEFVESGTLTGTAEDISAVLEAQSRRFGHELTI